LGPDPTFLPFCSGRFLRSLLDGVGDFLSLITAFARQLSKLPQFCRFSPAQACFHSQDVFPTAASFYRDASFGPTFLGSSPSGVLCPPFPSTNLGSHQCFQVILTSKPEKAFPQGSPSASPAFCFFPPNIFDCVSRVPATTRCSFFFLWTVRFRTTPQLTALFFLSLHFQVYVPPHFFLSLSLGLFSFSFFRPSMSPVSFPSRAMPEILEILPSLTFFFLSAPVKDRGFPFFAMEPISFLLDVSRAV